MKKVFINFFLNVAQNDPSDSVLNQTWGRYRSSTALNWTQNCRTVFSANFCRVALPSQHLNTWSCIIVVRIALPVRPAERQRPANSYVCNLIFFFFFGSVFRLKTCILVPNQWYIYSFFYCSLIVIFGFISVVLVHYH